MYCCLSSSSSAAAAAAAHVLLSTMMTKPNVFTSVADHVTDCKVLATVSNLQLMGVAGVDSLQTDTDKLIASTAASCLQFSTQSPSLAVQCR